MNTKERCDVPIILERLEYLKTLYYVERRSVPEISNLSGYSVSSLRTFMDRHGLVRRSRVEQNKARFDRQIPSFTLKQNLNTEEEILKAIGTMLYWGEGYKAEKGSAVDFANSNPAMIEVFLHFLRSVCGVDERKLRVYLYCYANQDPPALVSFWSDLTKIPENQFTKPYVRHDFDMSKIDKMKHGLIHIRYYDKKLLLLIKEWIEVYAQKFCADSPVGRGGGL